MPPAAREITLRFLAAPTDAGYSGNVSGGRVLEWIDKAGYACAVGWASTYSVTAYVGNVRFSRPVKVGDLVEATAKLVHTGRSSMHILVIVRSGNVQDRVLTEATQCLMVFVAMGADGRSTRSPHGSRSPRTTASNKPVLNDEWRCVPILRRPWPASNTPTKEPLLRSSCDSWRHPQTSIGEARFTVGS